MLQKSNEIDLIMARDVLGYETFFEKSGKVRERLPNGQTRPLRSYTLDMSAAFEIVQKLGITLIPITSGWFVLVGKQRGWESPAALIEYLRDADFTNAGAAVGEQAPMTICLAALRALQNRKGQDVPNIHAVPDAGPSELSH